MPSRRRRIPSPVLLAAVALAVALGLLDAHLGDVRVYRAGGRALLGGDLYGLRVDGFGFTYPPFAAGLFAAPARLPLVVMFVLLTVASAGAAVVVLRRLLPARAAVGTARRIAPLALVHPLVTTVSWGQVNLVLAALVLHDLLVRRSGALVGLAAAVKLTPAIFVLYLLVCGRTREARTAAVTFVAAAGVGAIVAPAASWRYWTHEVVAGSGVGGFDHTANQSVRGLLERLLGDGPGVAVWLVLAGPLLVLGLLLARRVVRDGQGVLAAGIVGVTACLVSPVSWVHHWVWCIPCLAALTGPARLALTAVFLNPVELGHTLGSGYPVVAVAALLVGWHLTGRPGGRQPRSSVVKVSQRRGSPERYPVVSHFLR